MSALCLRHAKLSHSFLTGNTPAIVLKPLPLSLPILVLAAVFNSGYPEICNERLAQSYSLEVSDCVASSLQVRLHHASQWSEGRLRRESNDQTHKADVLHI